MQYIQVPLGPAEPPVLSTEPVWGHRAALGSHFQMVNQGMLDC